MTIRLKTIECWKCKTPFDYTTKIPDDHIYFVYCPYCDSKNKVDLNPHRKQKETLFRGGTNDEKKAQSQISDEYDLPDKLYGTDPEE